MRAVAVIAMGGLVLGACGSEPESSAPEAPVPATTTAVAKSDEVVPIISLTDASLVSVCRAGLAFIHDQQVASIQSEGAANGVAAVFWPAPVDGGRRYADCRVLGNAIQWRPARLPDGQTGAWSDTPTDPVVRFTFEGDQIVLNQTNPDGATSQAMLPVPVQQEAAS